MTRISRLTKAITIVAVTVAVVAAGPAAAAAVTGSGASGQDASASAVENERASASEATASTLSFPDEGPSNTLQARQSLELIGLHADANGPDNENPNGEWMDFRNTGDEPIRMLNWTWRDRAGWNTTYSFVLDPGATMRLHIGEGENQESAQNDTTHVYLGFGDAKVNNGGDRIRILDSKSNLVIDGEYTGELDDQYEVNWTQYFPQQMDTETLQNARSSLRQYELNGDARGPDGENLTGEFVRMENVGDQTLEMGGWTWRDAAYNVYIFPEDFTLGPGERLTLHMGAEDEESGSTPAGRVGVSLFAEHPSPTLNNGGDTLTVAAPAGEIINRVRYQEDPGFDVRPNVTQVFPLEEEELNRIRNSLRVVGLQANAPGPDAENLNGEFMAIRNIGEGSVDMSGFIWRDRANNNFTFPDGFSLPSGTTMRLRMGAGELDEVRYDVYADFGSPTLNNGGDRINITSPAGQPILDGEYSGELAGNESVEWTQYFPELAPASFDVSGLDPADVTVTSGDVIPIVEATVANTGDQRGTETVEFRVGDTTVAESELTLEGGQNTTVEFTAIETGALEAGSYTHGIYVGDAESTATLTVESAATPTPTATPTDDPTATPTDTMSGDETATPTDAMSGEETATDTETSSDGGPGFGVAVGLVAVIAAALLLRRRE